ncbi:MAG: hypothetical protein ACPGMS_04785, partial [Candidatus Thalassarchaeaceae archaeon]
FKSTYTSCTICPVPQENSRKSAARKRLMVDAGVCESFGSQSVAVSNRIIVVNKYLNLADHNFTTLQLF